jgi:hypothetical protein
MSSVTIVAIVVGVLVLALVGWYVWQRQRTEALQARYGPEYDHTVRQLGDKRRAEAELVKRQERVEQLEIRPLSAGQRDGYVQQWRAVQARFVDDPKGAVTDADRLVEDVMKARGYPIADFDQRAADLSVHHPRVVENYRAARDIAQRHRRGDASTEDLRQAMVYYRELFQDLLEDREHAEAKAEAKADGKASAPARDRIVEREVERDDRAARDAESRAERRAEREDERVLRNNREVR